MRIQDGQAEVVATGRRNIVHRLKLLLGPRLFVLKVSRMMMNKTAVVSGETYNVHSLKPLSHRTFVLKVSRMTMYSKSG